jgi:hypothetical protein
MSKSKQITVRMPLELAMAVRERGNTAAYIVEAVRDKLARDRQASIAESLKCLGDDPESGDISDFSQAQATVISRGD